MRLVESIKNRILGKDYELSFSFVSPKEISRLNKIYRNINKATDILSFPLSEKEGELYICKSQARKEAKKFDKKYDDFIIFLLIHGMTHLKGFEHGSTMESIESKFRKEFGV